MAQPTEFDIAGATYYAVAPAGYSYSAQQDTNYDTRKYNTVAAAEAAISGTLSTPVVINVIGDWTGVSGDAGIISVNGMTPSETNYLLIRGIGDARTNGVWDTNKYMHLESGAFSGYLLYVDYVKIDGLQIGRNTAGASGYGGLAFSGGRTGIELSNCIIKGDGDPSGVGIGVNVSTATSLKVWNCVIYGFDHTNSSVGTGIFINNSSAVVDIYSCTVISEWVKAIAQVAGTVVAKNCYAHAKWGSSVDYSGTITKTTCASSDSTGSADLQNIAYDTNTFVNVTAGSEDHNLPVGSPLIGVGTNTTDDPAPLNFNDDIAGDTR